MYSINLFKLWRLWSSTHVSGKSVVAIIHYGSLAIAPLGSSVMEM